MQLGHKAVFTAKWGHGWQHTRPTAPSRLPHATRSQLSAYPHDAAVGQAVLPVLPQRRVERCRRQDGQSVAVRDEHKVLACMLRFQPVQQAQRARRHIVHALSTLARRPVDSAGQERDGSCRGGAKKG